MNPLNIFPGLGSSNSSEIERKRQTCKKKQMNFITLQCMTLLPLHDQCSLADLPRSSAFWWALSRKQAIFSITCTLMSRAPWSLSAVRMVCSSAAEGEFKVEVWWCHLDVRVMWWGRDRSRRKDRFWRCDWGFFYSSGWTEWSEGEQRVSSPPHQGMPSLNV